MSGANERLFLLNHPHLRITAGNPATTQAPANGCRDLYYYFQISSGSSDPMSFYLSLFCRFWTVKLPIQNRFLSLRRKMCPLDIAGDAIKRYPRLLRAASIPLQLSCRGIVSVNAFAGIDNKLGACPIGHNQRSAEWNPVFTTVMLPLLFSCKHKIIISRLFNESYIKKEEISNISSKRSPGIVLPLHSW